MNSLQAIREDQRGNESMQTVMIMAVGALILLAVSSLFKQVSPRITNYVSALVSGNDVSGSSNFALSTGTTLPQLSSNSPESSASVESEPTIVVSGREELPDPPQQTQDDPASRLREAELIQTAANRLDRLAELAHLADDDNLEDKLRAQAEALKLEAARIRDGERGVVNTQKQIDAANAMREFIDAIDSASELLPENVEKVYDWAKIALRDALPQLTEAIVDLEQKFHQWQLEQ